MGGKASREWWKWYDSMPKERIRKATRARTRYAIKHGKLKRLPCTICGDPKSEAHHEDYTDHMNVMWFCDTHHKKHHKTCRAGASS